MTTTTTETTMTTTTILSETMLTAIRTQARSAAAAAELETARKFIRQVSLSTYCLRMAGLSDGATEALLRSLGEVERAIADASNAADCKARDAQSVLLDLAEGLSK